MRRHNNGNETNRRDSARERALLRANLTDQERAQHDADAKEAYDANQR